MHTTAISFLTFAALAPQAFAGVFITNPVATTNGQGGQSMTINWQDDGNAPTLANIGPCEIGLFAGNKQQQTELQPINPSIDVSKQTSQDFNIDASVGPNSDAYFIRITSLALKDTANPQFPYEAFSAKFSLSGMSGQFNASVQAQVNGVTTAAAAGSTSGSASSSTPAVSGASTAASGITTAKASTTANAAAKSSAASSSAPSSTQPNAALVPRGNAAVVGLIGVIAALVGLNL